MRRGRPLRFWTLLLLLALGWLGSRWPALVARQHDLAAVLAAAAPPAALPPMPARLPVAVPVAMPVRPTVVVAAPSRPVIRPLLRPMLVAMAAPPPAGASPPPAPTLTDPTPPPVAATAAPAVAPATAPAWQLAQAGYDRLAAGQRRRAAALLDAALALEPGNRQWQRDRAALGRHWQAGGFALLRDAGLPAAATGGLAASPVLGGGQLGASLAFLPDPYARRPLALVARTNVAAGGQGVQAETAQAAVGLRQALLPGVSLSAERLIALGRASQSHWTLRLAGGGSAGRFSGYGEAGVLGNGQVYAGAQAQARLVRLGPAVLAAGSWASVQTGTAGAASVWRVDVGPSLQASIGGVRVAADWRQRVGGNAAPGSGPAITIAAGF